MIKMRLYVPKDQISAYYDEARRRVRLFRFCGIGIFREMRK